VSLFFGDEQFQRFDVFVVAGFRSPFASDLEEVFPFAALTKLERLQRLRDCPFGSTRKFRVFVINNVVRIPLVRSKVFDPFLRPNNPIASVQPAQRWTT
jgi:hypothetical protein